MTGIITRRSILRGLFAAPAGVFRFPIGNGDIDAVCFVRSTCSTRPAASS